METRSLTDRWRHGCSAYSNRTTRVSRSRKRRWRESWASGRLISPAPSSRPAGCMGWRAAARGHLGDVLPVARNEYLALDVIAFAESQVSWPLPVAVFELENSKDDDLIAYSLWKVLCVRAALRIVFAYRGDVKAGVELVGRLTDSVIGGLSIDDRRALKGETSLIIGNRGVAETFPYGYFKAWTLDTNTGRFDRV